MDRNKDAEDIAKIQPLFDEPIERISYLDPGYSGHASDVWLVKTRTGERVVRSSRWNEPPSREFWWGCYDLFGIDPRRMSYFQANAAMLAGVNDSIPAPRVYKHSILDGKEYLVVEKMNGTTFHSFAKQSEALLYQLGVWLARIHLQRIDHFGNLAGTQEEPCEQFHDRLLKTMRQLVENEHETDSKIALRFDAICSELVGLLQPGHFCPVFIDLDPSQFLIRDGLLSAVVDVEAYAVAPRELDFISLEYLLNEASAASFLKGYRSLLEPPDLSRCRNVYRYFYLLLGVQGTIDLDLWLEQKELF